MPFLERHYRFVLLSIPLLSLLMHLHILKLDLVGYHVWRQAQTQTTINNFYKEDMHILHPKTNLEPDTDRIRRIEFPLMQWLFAWFYKLFGNHIAISRILTFIIGLGSVYGMFRLCDALFRNKTIATIAAWAFNFSPVFYYYTVNPLPDNLALCFSIWMLVWLARYTGTYRPGHLLASACFLSLAALVKLPFIVYGAGLFVCIFLALKHQKISLAKFLAYGIACMAILIPVFAWYAWVIPTWKGGDGIVGGLANSQYGAGKILDFITGNLLSTLPELLLNYGAVLFFISGFYFMFRYRKYKDHRFLILLAGGLGVIAYFLYEINMIEAVHDYYLFPFLPFLFIIVSYGAYHLLKANQFFRYLSVIALLVLPVTAFVRANPRWNTVAPGFNPVYYQYKDQIRQLIPQDAIVVAGNDDSYYILLYYIDRKGWAYNHDRLDDGQMSFYVSQGAAYFFTDSDIDKREDIQPYLSDKIFEKGTVRIYKLKAKQ